MTPSSSSSRPGLSSPASRDCRELLHLLGEQRRQVQDGRRVGQPLRGRDLLPPRAGQGDQDRTAGRGAALEQGEQAVLVVRQVRLPQRHLGPARRRVGATRPGRPGGSLGRVGHLDERAGRLAAGVGREPSPAAALVTDEQDRRRPGPGRRAARVAEDARQPGQLVPPAHEGGGGGPHGRRLQQLQVHGTGLRAGVGAELLGQHGAAALVLRQRVVHLAQARVAQHQHPARALRHGVGLEQAVAQLDGVVHPPELDGRLPGITEHAAAAGRQRRGVLGQRLRRALAEREVGQVEGVGLARGAQDLGGLALAAVPGDLLGQLGEGGGVGPDAGQDQPRRDPVHALLTEDAAQLGDRGAQAAAGLALVDPGPQGLRQDLDRHRVTVAQGEPPQQVGVLAGAPLAVLHQGAVAGPDAQGTEQPHLHAVGALRAVVQQEPTPVYRLRVNRRGAVAGGLFPTTSWSDGSGRGPHPPRGPVQGGAAAGPGGRRCRSGPGGRPAAARRVPQPAT